MGHKRSFHQFSQVQGNEVERVENVKAQDESNM